MQSPYQPTSKVQSLLAVHLVFWIIYIIADSFDHIKNGYYDLLPSLICGVSALLLSGLAGAVGLLNENRGVKKQLFAFISVLFFAIAIWHKIFSILHRLTDTSIAEELQLLADYTILQWLQVGYMPLFLFLAWGGVFVAANWYFEHAKQQSLLNEAILSSKNAQLEALRYQINPHFLFNVLNSIDVSVLRDDKETAHKMLKHLSQFLRNNLQRGEQTKISLQQELEIIDDYISIESVRFDGQLTIQRKIDTECLSLMLPPMLLQPLVENAIKFAWNQDEVGDIELKVERIKSKMIITLRNSKSLRTVDKKGTGKGLKNIQERLALLYGEDAKLSTIENDADFVVKLKIPVEYSLIN